MPSFIWYFGLIAVGAAIMAFISMRGHTGADLITYFLFTTAWSWVGEAVVLFVLNGYAYKPGLYADPFADNIIGHIMANSALWATTAMAVMIFQPSSFWIAVISIAFMAIEEIFLYTDAYTHHWWHTYMTGFSAFVFMMMMKKWHVILQHSRHSFPRVTVFWTIAWIILQTPTSLLMLFDKQFFIVHWVQNPYRDSTLFSGFVYHIVMAFVVIFFLYVPQHRYWYVVPLGLLMLTDVILVHTGILILGNGWSLIHMLPIHITSLLLIMALDSYTLRRIGTYRAQAKAR